MAFYRDRFRDTHSSVLGRLSFAYYLTLQGFPTSATDPRGFGVVGNVINGNGLYPEPIRGRCVAVSLIARNGYPADIIAVSKSSRAHFRPLDTQM